MKRANSARSDKTGGSTPGGKSNLTHSITRVGEETNQQDAIAAETFCRVAQSCLWKTVPEGKPNLVPFPPLEVRRPITVRMKEQTAIIREQFKIIEADDNLKKDLARRKTSKMTTTELKHQRAVEMKEKAARMREEFGDTLRVKLRVASEDLSGTFAPAEQQDESEVQFADSLGVGVPELQRVKEVFTQLDNDGNGRIDFDEFRSALGKLLDAKDNLEPTHVRRIWEHLCVPPKKDVPFLDFAKWYVKHFVHHGGKPDIQGLLGQTRKVWRTEAIAEEVAAWHPKRNQKK
jgi:hypothetical protein